MKIREFDIARLIDGREVTVIDLTEPGTAYLVEIPTPDGPSKYDDFFVKHEEIAEVISSK